MAYWHEDFPSLPTLYVIETACVRVTPSLMLQTFCLMRKGQPFSCDALVSGEIVFHCCWWSGGRLVENRRREWSGKLWLRNNIAKDLMFIFYWTDFEIVIVHTLDPGGKETLTCCHQ